jgi:hypothetical protein
MVRHRRHGLPGELVAMENPHLPPPKYPRFTWWYAAFDRWWGRKYRQVGSGYYMIHPDR